MESDIFDKFIEMESSSHLFDIKEEDFFPVWDFVRVQLYIENLLYSDGSTILKLSRKDRIMGRLCQIVKGLYYPRNIDYAFFYCPTFLTSKREYYDRVAEEMINYTKDYNCICVGSAELYFNSMHKDYSLFPFKVLSKIKCRDKKLSIGNYEKMREAILKTFNVNIPYERLNALYKDKVSDYYTCRYFLRWVKPRKVFASLDTRKGLYLAARNLGIPTCEIQHGALVYQYPSYSYPPEICNSSNIAYADVYAMLGEGWGPNNNIPCQKRVSLGNTSYVVKDTDVSEDGSIVVISNAIHKKYLVPLTIELSRKYKGKIIYKLHPLEYSKQHEYEDKFEGCLNVEIASLNANLSSLLAKCSLVILVSSAVFFEAKTMGKRVAILKKSEYYPFVPFVDQSQNTCLVDNADDVLGALKMPARCDNVKYYKPFDEDVARSLL